jgi:ABC-type multidrug transport system fused ATPase/permease subunit
MPVCLAPQIGGPSGVCLSAGQAQLVCLARCLLSGAPLVLLDEATAAVDPKTAGLLQQVRCDLVFAGLRQVFCAGVRTVL